MRAALMEKGRIWVDTVEDPTPGPGELLVKSLACGICGSDLHAAKYTEEFVATSLEAGGAFKLTTFDPVVLGHEFCAEVVDYGPDTPHDYAPGQLVCSVPALARKPTLAVGYSDQTPGGFAEYMLLSNSLIAPVGPGTPAQHAALTEPMAVGYHAVNKARLAGTETALVIGAGPVGLAVIMSLKQRGIGPVVAAEPSQRRRALAEQLGADVIVDPRATSPYALDEIRRNDDAVIFECVGVPGMLDQIFLAAPRAARIVVVGVCLQMDHLRPLIAINKELNVQFVLGYTFEEFKQTLTLIDEGRLDVEPLITHEVALDGVGQAFDDLGHPDAHGKVLVAPWRQD
ncbi:MAG: zinc-binding dehydrogenase [Gammaproteobacteria bacterium]|nr:zinc-binding dehydrogenase [Gammaproteobacteria bacterium]